jgi:hypothetical protein
MRPIPNSSTIQVQLIGTAALDWLPSGQRGQVLASVTHAVYLLTEQNELVWLADRTGPMHRRCLQVSTWIPRLAVGSTCEVTEHSLVTGSGDVLDFSRSPVWIPPILPPDKVIAVARVPDRLTAVYDLFTAQHQPVGLGTLIPAILQVVGRRSRAEELNRANTLINTAWPTVEGIILACRAQDFRLVLEHAADLVGLGDGLTPSGDDFLSGFFFCIHLLRHVYPETLDFTTWNYSDFIHDCKPLTNLISFTLLKDHAGGHTLEPLHRFANALLEGHSVDHLLPFAGELITVGHSTGWDLLTGFLAGMSVTFKQ